MSFVFCFIFNFVIKNILYLIIAFHLSFSDDFDYIVSSVKGNSHAKCTVCFDFTICHCGRGVVLKHVGTHKHIDDAQCIKKNLNLMLMKLIKESLTQNIYFHHFY